MCYNNPSLFRDLRHFRLPWEESFFILGKGMKRPIAIVAFLAAVGLIFSLAPVRAEFVGGATPTGLITLERKHPYYVYVPPDYSAEHKWPLVFVLGKDGADPQKTIAGWTDWAKKNQFIILVPSIFPREGVVPHELEEWLIKVKEEVALRYAIDPVQVVLVGIGSGSHYAAYFATRFPKEFPAAVLIGQAWVGPLERLIRPSSDPGKQIAFYVTADPKGKNFSSLEKKTLEFEKMGYRIAFEPLQKGDTLGHVQERMLVWFKSDVTIRTETRKRPRVTWKEKFKGFVKDFTEV